MAVHTIKKGLNLPITGEPEQSIKDGQRVTRVGLLADDFPFMKARMMVNVGDTVTRGQVLFEDRKTPGVFFTSPAAGTIAEVNRGDRRALRSVVVDIDPRDSGQDDLPAELHHTFESFASKAPSALSAAEFRALLVESGLWTAFRERPYSKVPAPDSVPRAIFVTAIDTNPLGPDLDVVLAGNEAHFKTGTAALSKLTDGNVFVCRKPGSKVSAEGERVTTEEFAGPHPAGLPGTHIHFLSPVGTARSVWYVGLQDVVAIGKLVVTGQVSVDRVLSLAGPSVKAPTLIRTRLGASTTQLTAGLLADGEVRVVSGSVLYGSDATEAPLDFCGRYTNQISCLAEDRERVFLGWLQAGGDRFSTIRAYASKWFGGNKKFAFTTTTHGSHRAMVPIGMFERVMPLDIMPTFLLRALLMDDVERAVALGALELDEEDLALCTFVSPGKEDYGKALRRNLLDIWKNG